MVFASNKEKIESYIFKYMMLQQNKSDFILCVNKEVEAPK